MCPVVAAAGLLGVWSGQAEKTEVPFRRAKSFLFFFSMPIANHATLMNSRLADLGVSGNDATAGVDLEMQDRSGQETGQEGLFMQVRACVPGYAQ
jgi:hypothetical protein